MEDSALTTPLDNEVALHQLANVLLQIGKGYAMALILGDSAREEREALEQAAELRCRITGEDVAWVCDWALCLGHVLATYELATRVAYCVKSHRQPGEALIYAGRTAGQKIEPKGRKLRGGGMKKKRR